MNTKSKIQTALTENFPVGTNRAFYNEIYGEILIVSTGVAGNLIPYNFFLEAIKREH